MSELKTYRQRAGLTQYELADRLNISRRTMQDYEQGRKPLDKAAAITILNMSHVLDCTVEDLIDPKGEKRPGS